MKTRYPIEAFALAMVVFSQNLRNALITGILILLITTVGLLLDQLFGGKIPGWSRISCNIILMGALTYSIFQVVLIAILGYETQSTDFILHIFLGLLIAKHIIEGRGDVDYNRFLLEGAGAYAVLLIISIIREFMAYGSIYGFKLLDFTYKSAGFSNVIAGFVLTGLGVAILNSLYKKETYNIITDGLPVNLAVALVVQPFLIDSINQWLSMAVTLVIVLILYYSVRRYLVFSRLSKEIKGLPAELISMGFIYLILSMF